MSAFGTAFALGSSFSHGRIFSLRSFFAISGCCGLLAELVVDLDSVLNKKNGHHKKLVSNSDNDGSNDHNGKTVITCPFFFYCIIVSVIIPDAHFINLEKLKETVNNACDSEEGIEEFQYFFNPKGFEIEKVVKKN